MKKLISFLCFVAVLFSTVVCGFSVSAKQDTQNIVVKSHGTDVIESVIISGSDIYVDAQFLNRHTNYKVSEYNNGIRFKKGNKYINASFDGTTVNNNTVSDNIGATKIADNKVYYSLANVLKIIDSYAAVEEGKLLISNDVISVWELFNTFDTTSVKFDLNTEYAKDTKSLSELSNGFMFQKLGYLKSNLKNIWSNSTTLDMINNLIDTDVSYDICLDLMNDYDAIYDAAKIMTDAGDVLSVFDVISASDSEKFSSEFGGVGNNVEFITAYYKSNEDKIDLISSVFDLQDDKTEFDNQTKKTALEVISAFSNVNDISDIILDNFDDKEQYYYFINSNAPIKSNKVKFKNEMSKLNLYSVLSELGLNKYLNYSNSVVLTEEEGKRARLAAIQYIYFAKKAFETMQLYYEDSSQKDVAKSYDDKIEMCNLKLSEFYAAGTSELCNDSFSVSDYKQILSKVGITNISVNDSQQSSPNNQALELLSVFTDSCKQLKNEEMVYVGDSATKGQIGAVIYCVMSNKDYYMLPQSKVEIVKSTKEQFNKIFDAVNNTYKETDIERCEAQIILDIIKEKFNIDLVLNKYDVYQYIYYEEGYFYNYHDAFIKDDNKVTNKFKIKKIKNINNNYSVVQFTKTKYDLSTDKSKNYNGYAVVNLDNKAIFEYDETRSNISASRLKNYK